MLTNQNCPNGVSASSFAVARRLSIQMRSPCSQTRSRSTRADPNAFPMCADALSLDARRTKCVSYVLRCALARHLPINMCFLSAQMRSRSTLVDPNAFTMYSDALQVGQAPFGTESINPSCRLELALGYS